MDESRLEHEAAAWHDAGRPGYFGRRRDAIHAEYDAEYGEGNWRVAHLIDGETLSLEEFAERHYEEAYYCFLKDHPDVFDRLIREAGDVYDDSPTNVASGLDYANQETDRNHIQDIAIRRCVHRLGHVFRGPALVQIRDRLGIHEGESPEESLSMILSPGQVPFHRPELIPEPQEHGWWEPGSVEAAYQSSKRIQVRR